MSTPKPDDPDAFARLFEEMADILQNTLENTEMSFGDELPKDLEAKLAQLEHDVDAFCELNASLIEEANMRGEGTIDLEHLTRHERRVLERTNKLIIEAEEKQIEFSKVKPDANFGRGKERKKFLKKLGRKKV
jgi:hypothetical protein